MTKKGILKRSEDHDTRIQRTIKSLVKTWTEKNLQIKEDEWNNIKVTEIEQTNSKDSDIVFITFENREEAAKLTSCASNIPNNGGDDAPCLIMYTDPRAKKRYKAIQAVAKAIRNKSGNTVQTSLEWKT